jgi:hypothetical protein
LVGHVQEANEDVEDALLDVWVSLVSPHSGSHANLLTRSRYIRESPSTTPAGSVSFRIPCSSNCSSLAESEWSVGYQVSWLVG